MNEHKVYILLIIDRHVDPDVLIFSERDAAEDEAFHRAREYWGVFEAKRTKEGKEKTAVLQIICGDVGSMTVQEKNISRRHTATVSRCGKTGIKIVE